MWKRIYHPGQEHLRHLADPDAPDYAPGPEVVPEQQPATG
jgi:hypothetical protein